MARRRSLLRSPPRHSVGPPLYHRRINDPRAGYIFTLAKPDLSASARNSTSSFVRFSARELLNALFTGALYFLRGERPCEIGPASGYAISPFFLFSFFFVRSSTFALSYIRYCIAVKSKISIAKFHRYLPQKRGYFSYPFFCNAKKRRASKQQVSHFFF